MFKPEVSEAISKILSKHEVWICMYYMYLVNLYKVHASSYNSH